MIRKLVAVRPTEKRKARTHRLIEIGAEVEAAFGFALDTPEKRKALGDFLREQERNGGLVSKYIENAKEQG